MRKIGIVIQARYASTRLPGKVLLPLTFHPEGTLLDQVIRIGKSVERAAEVILATTTNDSDDKLVAVAARNGIKIVRGGEDDVLGRFVTAAEAHGLTTIVRLTADNPFIDPTIVDEMIDSHINSKADYSYSNGLPLGMNVEIVEATALTPVNENEVTAAEKEHVTGYVRNRPGEFNLQYVGYEKDLEHLRLTVDTKADYLLARKLYFSRGSRVGLFSYQELKEIFAVFPELFSANEAVVQKVVYPDLKAEMIAAIDLLKKQDYNYLPAYLADFLSPDPDQLGR